MKVLFVFNHPAPYKVETFNGLAHLLDIDVIFERKKAKDRPQKFYDNNVYNFKHIFLKRGAFSLENSNTSELVKYIKKHHQEYDLIIMNGYATITEQRAIHYMIKYHIPYILQINGGVIKKDFLFKKKLKTYYISHADKYLSPCKEADKYLIYYGAKVDNIYHYPYSNYHESDVLNDVLTIEQKNRYKKRWSLPESPLFVCASQFIERKNNIQLFDVFKKVSANLLLIGDGKEKEHYISYLKENNIQNVEIRDYMSKKDLFDLFKGCDFFITLSKQDIFGHTTLEAMSNGLPVISSDKVVASLEVIKNGENGYIVSLEDEEKMIKCINDINTNMSLNAIKTAKENTIEKSVIKIAEILKEIKA